MKRETGKYLSLLTLFFGISIIFYPTISSYFTQLNQDKVIEQMAETVAELTDEEKQKEIRKAQQYNEAKLSNVVITDPYSSKEEPINNEYNEILNLNDEGYMATLVIPKIDVRIPVYHGTSDEVLNKGAGHLPMTSLPVGGPNTHSVISAHSGLVNAKMFDGLHELNKGETFYFNILGEEHHYKIIDISIVKPNEFSKLQVVPNKDYVTLLTCTPIGVNTDRLLVLGERIAKEEKPIQQPKLDNQNDLKGLLIGAMILIVLLLVFVGSYAYSKKRTRVSKKKKRNRRK